MFNNGLIGGLPGSLSELMGDVDRSFMAYENALRHNPYSAKALSQMAAMCRMREQYPRVSRILLLLHD